MPSPGSRRAVVVFGAAVGADGEPRALLRLRLRVARDLARSDPASAIVVTGGVVRGRAAEGPAMARWLCAGGVPAARIVVEPTARTTRENADRVVPLLRALQVRQATVVTQRFHASRALFNLQAALRRAGLEHVSLDVSPAPDPRPEIARLLAGAAEALKQLGDRAARCAGALGRGLELRARRAVARLRGAGGGPPER